MRKLIVFIFLCLSSVTFAQTVSNVKSTREGTDFYTITYHLSMDAIDVKISVSLDGGKTFSQPLKEVYGDVGRVLAGDHTIYWNSKNEIGNVDASSVVFKISTGDSDSSVSGIIKSTHSGNPSKLVVSRPAPKPVKAFFQCDLGGCACYDFDSGSNSAFGGLANANVGVLLMRDRFAHNIGIGFEYYFDGYPALVMEYRFLKSSMKGLWAGVNVGFFSKQKDCYIYDEDIDGDGRLTPNDFVYRREKYKTPTGHILIGYQFTKWFGIRCSVGYPKVGLGISVSIPNMFYKF